MGKTLIRWKLKDVMDRHGIQAKELALSLGVSQNAVTNMRRSEMPRIDGDRLNALLMTLNKMRRSGTAVLTPVDLIEFSLTLDEAREVQFDD